MKRKKPKNKAAQQLRALGVKKTSPERRTEIATKAGQERARKAGQALRPQSSGEKAG